MTNPQDSSRKDQTARLRDWMTTDMTLIAPRWAVLAAAVGALALLLVALD